MTKISKIVAGVSTLGVLGLVALPVATYAANTESTNVIVTVGATLSIANPTTDKTPEWGPTTFPYTTDAATAGNETLKAETNSAGGLNVKAHTSTVDGSLTNSTNTAIGSYASDPTSVGSGGPITNGSGASLSADQWGVKFGDAYSSASNYYALTSSPVQITQFNTTLPGSITKHAYYDINVTSSVPAGTWKTIVTYTVANN